MSDRLAYAVDVTCTALKAVGTLTGGASWFETLGKLPGEGYADLAFINPSTGFAFGRATSGVEIGTDGSAVRTSDGGAHWRAVVGLSGTVVDLVPVGTSVWALTEAPDGQGGVVADVSDDQGVTWRPTPVAPPGLVGGGLDLLVRPTATSAFVLARGPAALGTGSGQLVYTGDGGASWSARSDPCVHAGSEDLAAVSAADLWAVCAGARVPAATGGPGSVKEPHWVYRSSDGGRTWQLVASPPATEKAGPGQIPPLSFLGRLAAIDAQRAWIALAGPGPGVAPPGDQGIFATTDGGRTWHQAFTIDPNGQGGTPDVAFVGGTNGWAVADSGIWRTANGVTWTRVVPCRPQLGC